MKTDAIVNAANPALLAGSGVCGAIFRAAGYDELSAECRQKAPCPTGQSVLTSAYRLPARYIIHTAGPRRQGVGGRSEHLASCYSHSSGTAMKAGCKSISFPLISSGHFWLSRTGSLRCCLPGHTDIFTMPRYGCLSRCS